MWQKHPTAPAPARDLRRRLVLGLALLLQLLAVTVFQVEHLSATANGGLPCPVHAGMVMPAQGGPQPGQPSSPTDNCPCCGVACACAGAQLALPASDFAAVMPSAVCLSEVRLAATSLPPARRYVTAATARGPPSRTV